MIGNNGETTSTGIKERKTEIQDDLLKEPTDPVVYFRSMFEDELNIERQNVKEMILAADSIDKKINLLRSWRKRYANISQVTENVEDDPTILNFSLSQYSEYIPFYEVIEKKYPWISALEKQDRIHLMDRLIESFLASGKFSENFLSQIPLLFKKYKSLKRRLDVIDANPSLGDSEARKLKALARYEEFSYGGRSVFDIARSNYDAVNLLLNSGILQRSELGRLLLNRIPNLEMYASHFSNRWGYKYILKTGELTCAAELQENPNIPFKKFTWVSDAALRNDSMCFFCLGSHDSRDYGSRNDSRNGTPFYLDIGNNPGLLNGALVRVHITQFDSNENILPTEAEQMSLDSELYPATNYKEILIFQLYRKFIGNEDMTSYEELIFRLKNDNDEELLRYIDDNQDDLGVYLEIIVPSHVKLWDLIVGSPVK